MRSSSWATLANEFPDIVESLADELHTHPTEWSSYFETTESVQMNTDPNDHDASGVFGRAIPCGALVTIPPRRYSKMPAQECLQQFSDYNLHLPHNTVSMIMWEVRSWECLNDIQKYIHIHIPFIVHGE